jgi:hypothetical protein
MTALALMRLLPDNGGIAEGHVRLGGLTCWTCPRRGCAACAADASA